MKFLYKVFMNRFSLTVLFSLISIHLIGKLVFQINIYEKIYFIIGEKITHVNGPIQSWGTVYEQLNPFYHRESGLWGYEDGKTSKVVIEPKYDTAKEFQEDRAIVEKDGLWGFIDKRGKEVIPLKYKEVNPFNEGLSRVKQRSEYYGYIDSNGKIIIGFQFNSATDFNTSKVAKVGKLVDKEFRYFAINTKGEIISDYHENEDFMLKDE